MNRRRVARARWLVVALALPGCLQDVPALDGSTETETGTDTAEGTSPTSAPESTAADADADATMDGSVGGSSDSGDEAPCDPDDDPQCVAPGGTIWTVVIGEDMYDAAYAVAVDGDRVLVAGERGGVDDSSSPWSARLAGADGAVDWSLASPAGNGHSDLRAIVAAGDGRSLAAGNVPGEAVKTTGYLEGRDDAGESGFVATYDFANTNYLLGLRLDDAGGFHAVGYTGTDADPAPLLLHYTANGNTWEFETSSDDTAVFSGISAQLFALDTTGDGRFVIVGARIIGDDSDAMVLLTTPEGEVLDEQMIGGDLHDGFVDVDVDADGSGIAVGRTGTGGDNGDLLMLHFTVGDALELGWQHPWGEAVTTNINGFARDGDTVFIAAGTLDDPADFTAYDSLVVRWDGENAEPTWAVPFEAGMPGRDYAMDVALFDDDTIVACGVVTPDGADFEDAWIRKLAR